VPLPIAKIDISELERGDVLYCSGRPDTTDGEAPRKRNQPHSTDIQVEIAAFWREYLALFERRRIKLQRKLQRLLAQKYADRMMLFVSEKSPSRLVYSDRNDRTPRTHWKDARRIPVFLLRVNEFRPKGPDLVHAFGLDGKATMIWAGLLGTSQRRLLRTPGFTYAELYGGEVPERPTDLRWTEGWKLDLVLQVPSPQAELRAAN
jgi:hypothetical protein